MIQIAQRLRPFSHTPGTHTLIPASSLSGRVFPSRIFFTDLSSNENYELRWELNGPFEGFTFIQDLERRHLRIFAESKEGYFRFCLSARKEGLSLFVERADTEIPFVWEEKRKVLKEKQEWILPVFFTLFKPTGERLSLGSHKKLDWDLVKRRSDMREILPIWFRLSIVLDKTDQTRVPRWLKNCHIKDKNEAEKHFLNLFRIGFWGIMVPRLVDEDHQRIIRQETLMEDADPLILLSEGGKWIRSLFFRAEKQRFYLLPALPKGFAFGRFTNITSAWGEFDLDWSKRILRKAVFRARRSAKLELVLQKQIRSFRVRNSHRDKGKIFSRETPLLVEENHTYYLDRFQK